MKLHPEKTRLLEFGRSASDRRRREGREPCETFEFLGFTHICGKTRKNKRFVLWRRTSRKRLSRTLALREKIQQAQIALAKDAVALAEKRETAAERLKKNVEKELRDLNMKDVQFGVRFN